MLAGKELHLSVYERTFIGQYIRGVWGVFVLTQLVPELSVLVGHGGALLSPQCQPRVGHELFCDQC